MARRPWQVNLIRDGWLLLAARALRLFGSGLVSVVLAVYLAALGLPPSAIGVVFTTTLAGTAALTITVAAAGDRVGRRRLLVLMGLLMALAGVVFAVTDRLWVLTLAGFVGVITPGGGEVGSSLALEQAALAQVIPPRRRTSIYAWANLIASAAASLGALAAGAVTLAQRAGLGRLPSYRLALWVYAALGLAVFAIFARLSPAVEPIRPTIVSPRRLGLHRSRGLVSRFAALLAWNSFSANFVAQAFVALYFVARFGAGAATLGMIFFLTNLAGALSYPVATRIAGRIGLINTMVFTHLPSNLLLLFVPVMPTLPLAAAALVGRHALSQMDRPARDSYTMAVVAADERTAAAGYVSVATDLAGAGALAVAGVLAQTGALSLLFVVAGVGRIGYDAALYFGFRHLHPLEEAEALPGNDVTI
jgi:MFS family permease